MSRKSNRSACGLGRHCLNDLFHQTAIFPGTPSYVVCVTHPELFKRYKARVPEFAAQFIKRKFFDNCTKVVNSKNPFEFNIDANNAYISSYIDVFRRVWVCVSQKLYNLYMECGLLDPNHVIGAALEITCYFTRLVGCFCFSGEPYPKEKWQGKLLNKKWKDVRVYLRGKPLRAYTIILAKCPAAAGWTDGPIVSNSILSNFRIWVTQPFFPRARL
jgi:hypothetical protein